MAERIDEPKSYQEKQEINSWHQTVGACKQHVTDWLSNNLLKSGLLLCAALCMLGHHFSLPLMQDVNDVLGLYDDGKYAVVSTAEAGETQLHFIDVGQGDATLIAQSGEYALVDAGIADATQDILAYLDSLEVERIELLVMTHSHADHIGAMDEIIKAYEIGTVILPDFSLIKHMPTSASLEKVVTALENSDAKVVTAKVGDVYALGEGSVTVVSAGVPASASAENSVDRLTDGATEISTENENNLSVSTLFTAGNFSLLCTGDAEAVQEEAMIESGVNLRATIFQAGHHGSSTSNTLPFLRAVQPELVVISCGRENKFGHPHGAVLENYDAVGADYYRTDVNGNVVLTYTATDGMAVYCEHENVA